MISKNNNENSSWFRSILAQIEQDITQQKIPTVPVQSKKSNREMISSQLNKEFAGSNEKIEYVLNHADVTDINIARWLMKNVMDKAMRGYDPIPQAMNAIRKFNEIKNSFPSDSGYSKDLSAYSYDDIKPGKIPLTKVIKETLQNNFYNASPSKRKSYLPVSAQNIIINIMPTIKTSVPVNRQQDQLEDAWRFITFVYLFYFKSNSGLRTENSRMMDIVMDFQKNNHPSTWPDSFGLESYLAGLIERFRTEPNKPSSNEETYIDGLKRAMINADMSLGEDKDDYILEMKRFISWKHTPTNDEEMNDLKQVTRLNDFDSKNDLHSFNDEHMSDEEKNRLYLLDPEDTIKDKTSGDEFERLSVNGLTAIRLTKWTPHIAQNLCKNANWCIKREQQFNDYNISESNPVFLILKGNQQLAMVGFDSKQIKDVNDDAASEELVSEIYPILKVIADKYYGGKIPYTSDFDNVLYVDAYIEEIENRLYNQPITNINDFYNDLKILSMAEKLGDSYNDSTSNIPREFSEICRKRENEIKKLIVDSPASEEGAELLLNMINTEFATGEDGLEYVKKMYLDNHGGMTTILAPAVVLMTKGVITKEKIGQDILSSASATEIKADIWKEMEEQGYQKTPEPGGRLKIWLLNKISTISLLNLMKLAGTKETNEIRNTLDHVRNELCEYISSILGDTVLEQTQTASWLNKICRFAAKNETKCIIDLDGIDGVLGSEWHQTGNFNGSYSNEKSCSGKKFKVELDLDDAAKKIQKKCSSGYYQLLFSGNSVRIVFRDRIFSLSRDHTPSELKEIKKWGKKSGIDEEYFDGIKKDIRTY